jgi:mono/diheme cytochrome c family protein
VIHRVFATLLMVGIVIHLGGIGYRRLVLGRKEGMVPGMADVRAGFRSLRFGLGLRDDPPKQGRYTWAEKAEYWSLVWGTVIMVVTGFLLWNPVATARLLPGDFIPAAKAAHSAEALLAILAVLVWHFYHVHIREFNTSMITGYLGREEMEEEHPLELAEIESGARKEAAPSPEEKRRRTWIYFPVYGVVAVVLLFGIYQFVTFEDTAIATIEPVSDVRVFAPVETTTTIAGAAATTSTVPLPEGPLTWADTFGPAFDQLCSDCHGGNRRLGGLSLATYEAAVAGGVSGPGIVPGDPEASALYVVQAAGGHAGQLDDAGVAALGQWIADGAPPGDLPEAPPAEETTTTTTAAESTTTTAAAAETPTWEAGVADLLQADCGACHGAAQQLGGVDFSTYESTLEWVTPGDPEDSPLYLVQVAGGHPGQFDDAGLETIREWIATGALESEGAEPPQAAGPTWDDTFAPLFTQQCVACHSSTNPMGGVNLASYEGALAAVEPGDPEASPLFVVQAAGGHPGQLEDEAVVLLGIWIADGAPKSG